jgi:hypothetical protein
MGYLNDSNLITWVNGITVLNQNNLNRINSVLESMDEALESAFGKKVDKSFFSGITHLSYDSSTNTLTIETK